MRLTVLGTGSAMPVPDRAQTGYLLEADGADRRLLLDCGAGTLGRLAGTDAGYEGVSTVLLSHHHLDHVADLLPLLKARWLAGETDLTVVGPPGTRELVEGLLDVHDYLRGRMDLTLRDLAVEADGANDRERSTFEVAGFEVAAFETRHSMQCFAYRFGDLTVSGDSEAYEGLAAFADGSQVLLHDCSFPDGVDVDNHPTPTQLGRVLAGREVDRLYLTHLYPHTEGRHAEMVDAVRDRFDGDVRVASDGLRIEV